MTNITFIQCQTRTRSIFIKNPTMPLFENKLPLETAVPKTEHPWSRTIKDFYSNKIKHAHNSVNNPAYPDPNTYKKKKFLIPDKSERIQFTIIGDLVTKEFIFCSHLVKGLHKNKQKIFDAPIIRGITSVDWPSVWNNLKLRFGGLAFCLRSKVAVLINDQFLGGEEELKQWVEVKYTYHFCLDYYKESIAEFAKFVRCSGRPFAYMHISIDEKHIGTLIFMLYVDIVPFTCENFLRLCAAKRGGYSGTPIHRIVKDGWIQGGGFGLKETPLDCENFIIPHDKRGVLCMANAERHVECSTQFFVLLQPAAWMAHKYVAFGQLVEGAGTLKKIEECPTWYEAPTSVITIYKAGIFNMDCHDIMINRGANEYIHSHIEDLNALAELLYERLLENVFLTAQMRELEKEREIYGEGAEGGSEEAAGLHATHKFKKEDIEKELQKTKINAKKAKVAMPAEPQTKVDHENDEFDVEEYPYEYESDETYCHMSIRTVSLVVKPEKHYYLPLTDVPYPGEIPSDFNLRRFLNGDYCLECDLGEDREKKTLVRERLSFISDVFNLERYQSDSSSDFSLDSDDEREIRTYLRSYVDSVSFAGEIIRNIAKSTIKFSFLDSPRPKRSELITDDNLRKLKLATAEFKNRQGKRVSIQAPLSDDTGNKVKRRQTGFVRPEDLEKIHIIHKSSMNNTSDDDDGSTGIRRVRISESTETDGRRIQRQPTGFLRPSNVDESETTVRQSVLVRLYDEVKADDEPPTLKDYRPMSEYHRKTTFIQFSPTSRLKSDENTKEKYLRHSVNVKCDSYEHLMSMQHGKVVSRKISSDYVKTIDHLEHKDQDNSIRTVEYAKTRPAISVSEYQLKNRKYQEQLKTKAANVTVSKGGLRLPGDSPLYSTADLTDLDITRQNIPKEINGKT